MYDTLAAVGAFGSLFGSQRCEVHVELLGGVHVAHAFAVQADETKMRDSGMEFLAGSMTVAFRLACEYLTHRHGHRASGFLPAPLRARTILPASATGQSAG